jgi:fanconi-associated nuclease 1
MTIKSPNVSTLNSIIFSGSPDAEDVEHFERRIEELESRTDDTKLGCRRPSIYVEAFEGAYQIDKTSAE